MRCVVLGMRNAVRCEIWCYGDMVIWPALQARAFTLVNIFNCVMDVRRSLSSLSFVIPKKSTQSWTLLLARARARQVASGGFAIWISATGNRSDVMKLCILKICRYCTVDYPAVCTNNSGCRLLAILANKAAVASVLSIIEYGI